MGISCPELAANIVRIIRVPLSVDIEGGYANDPTAVGENIKPFLDAGVVGINIKDGDETPALLAAKIEWIRKTAAAHGIDLFVNARADVYLRGLVPEGQRVEEAVSRAKRYKSAGADGFFVPALSERKEIITIVQQVGMPVNLMVWPGLAPAKQLGELGVRRLSAGAGIPQVLWAHAEKLAREFLETGRSSEPMSEGYMPHTRLQGLFADR
jgi:2-methylisocitrate lyase-like PEP mutase family enzyme